jgi:hypothetical protein
MRTWFSVPAKRAASGSIIVLVALFGAAPAAGCARGEPAPDTASADVPFDVEVSQLFVTVVNRSTRPISDIRVTIVPAGPLRFTADYARLDPGAKRAFSMNGFRARDNTPLNLRVVRPRSVLVEATDADGEKHELRLPWTP